MSIQSSLPIPERALTQDGVIFPVERTAMRDGHAIRERLASDIDAHALVADGISVDALFDLGWTHDQIEHHLAAAIRRARPNRTPTHSRRETHPEIAWRGITPADASGADISFTQGDAVLRYRLSLSQMDAMIDALIWSRDAYRERTNVHSSSDSGNPAFDGSPLDGQIV